MTVQSATKTAIRERASGELKEFLALAAYLYICLGALLLLKSAILQDAGITFTAWGIAAIKALVLAKFMLLGRALRIGEQYKHKPLIWPTLHKSFAFLILLLVLTAIEEVVVGAIHHRAVSESWSHVVGPTVLSGMALSLIMFLILVHLFALRCF